MCRPDADAYHAHYNLSRLLAPKLVLFSNALANLAAYTVPGDNNGAILLIEK